MLYDGGQYGDADAGAEQYPGYVLLDVARFPEIYLFSQFHTTEELLGYYGVDRAGLRADAEHGELARAALCGPDGGIGGLSAGSTGQVWVTVEAVRATLGWIRWVVPAYQRLAQRLGATGRDTEAELPRQHALALDEECERLAALLPSG